MCPLYHPSGDCWYMLRGAPRELCNVRGTAYKPRLGSGSTPADSPNDEHVDGERNGEGVQG